MTGGFMNSTQKGVLNEALAMTYLKRQMPNIKEWHVVMQRSAIDKRGIDIFGISPDGTCVLAQVKSSLYYAESFFSDTITMWGCQQVPFTYNNKTYTCTLHVLYDDGEKITEYEYKDIKTYTPSHDYKEYNMQLEARNDH
jgi:hypothetical protein